MNDELLTSLPENIDERIFLIRGQRVVLSSHLAELYEVEVRALVQAVKRNQERFPDDFMFQLTDAEYSNLKSQIVTSSWGGARRANPYAFTEQGVAMLSSVLRSPRAIAVNIKIMRAFVQMRRLLAGNAELTARLEELEKSTEENFQIVFEALRQLIEEPIQPDRRIGFRQSESIEVSS